MSRCKSIQELGKFSKCFLLITVTLFGFVAGLPFGRANSSKAPDNSSNTGTSASQLPRTVGSDPVPDLRLPRPNLSTIDDAIAEGGVDQAAADNITLYNTAVRMRLLGFGKGSHDQLLSNSGDVLSNIGWRI